MSPKECKQLSHVWLFATPWAAACQAPLSMEFSRQEYWKGLPLPSPGGLPDPEIKLRQILRHRSHQGNPESTGPVQKVRVAPTKCEYGKPSHFILNDVDVPEGIQAEE